MKITEVLTKILKVLHPAFRPITLIRHPPAGGAEPVTALIPDLPVPDW